MGRPPLNLRALTIRMPAEVLARIEKLVGNRRIAQFVRRAVEREIVREERRAEREDRS